MAVACDCACLPTALPMRVGQHKHKLPGGTLYGPTVASRLAHDFCMTAALQLMACTEELPSPNLHLSHPSPL